MNRYIKQLTILMSIFAVLFSAGCSDDMDPLVNSLDFNRLFSPQNLEISIRNQTSAVLNWKKVDKATHYKIEVFNNGNQNFTGTPIKSVTIEYGLVPYLISGFEGETDYSVRVQATGEGIEASKWTSTTFTTGTEQIFLPIDPEEIQATQATLHWTPGETATDIVLHPGDIRHSVTADEITAGTAIVTGLTGETTYTARLMNGTKTRGTITFTTLIDLGGATAINEGDDLVAILDAAEEGAAFVIFPGSYTLGSYEVKKSVKLSGYKPNDKPLIYGQLKCASAVASLELRSLIFRGDADPTAVVGQFFNTVSGCNISLFSLIDCEISNYNNNFIYNNASGTFGEIRISGCYVHDIPGSGGDGIDFRGGTLGALAIENTTFAKGFRTFLRMQASANISFKNCTFYQISCLDDGNNHGLFRCSGGGTFEVRNCLFSETGKDNPTNATVGNWCRNANNMTATSTYSKNFYYNCPNLWAGYYTDPSACDAKEADPKFVDAANGNFKITNEDLIGVAGDPKGW